MQAMIQTFLLKNLTGAYAPLVAQIRKEWKDHNTDLYATISAIQHYAVDKETPKALATHMPRTPKKRKANDFIHCNNQICVQKGTTHTHSNDRCFESHPELRRKKPKTDQPAVKVLRKMAYYSNLSGESRGFIYTRCGLCQPL